MNISDLEGWRLKVEPTRTRMVVETGSAIAQEDGFAVGFSDVGLAVTLRLGKVCHGRMVPLALLVLMMRSMGWTVTPPGESQ